MSSSIILIILNFITGTFCIIFGVNLMSSSLEKANVYRIKKLLSALTGKIPFAVLTGTFITALVQSSTAVTVLTVGLVNSGLMKLPQAIGVIYGANIGTTITAQIMSLKVNNLSYFIVILGLLIKFISKKHSMQSIGFALTGLGLMFCGLNFLTFSVPYIKESETFYEIFKTYGQNPLAGVLLGMITTMLVHSSSATVGITIVLFNSNLISFEAAIGLTLGDNIGTCVTAQIASLKTGINARRTAWAHTLYNIIGVLIVFIFFIPFTNMVQEITYLLGQNKSKLIANAHTIFNILSALVFLPFTKYYVKFIKWLIRE
ncbi:UNVERIFIED_CONTAM: phosphate:Na+ symporter [Acetivibrio alkalicellulosi]